MSYVHVMDDQEMVIIIEYLLLIYMWFQLVLLVNK